MLFPFGLFLGFARRMIFILRNQISASVSYLFDLPNQIINPILAYVTSLVIA